MPENHAHHSLLSRDDMARLRELRAQRPFKIPDRRAHTRGQRIADWVAELVGSWQFIVAQSAILAL